MDLDRLYERKSSWTLQEDSLLIDQLNAITNYMLESMRTFDDLTSNLHRDAELLKLRINNVHNNIHLLKATKLVEETITEAPFLQEHIEQQRDGEITCVGAEERTTNAIKTALEKCFQFVENLSQSKVTELDVGPSGSQFKSPYANRQLPPIIGSAEFYTTDRFGAVGSTPSAQPSAAPSRSLYSNVIDVGDDVSRQSEFDATLPALDDNHLFLRSADTDSSCRLPNAQSSVGGQRTAAADDARSLKPSSQSHRVDSHRSSPSSSSNRSDRSAVAAAVYPPPQPQAAQFCDSLAAALQHRPLGDISLPASINPAASAKKEQLKQQPKSQDQLIAGSGESVQSSVSASIVSLKLSSEPSRFIGEPINGATRAASIVSAYQHLSVQSRRSAGHGLFSSSSSDEETPEGLPPTEPQSKSITVQQQFDNVNEEDEDMSKPKPVLKAFDANFSDRLSVTLLRNGSKKAVVTAPPVKRSDDVTTSSTTEPIGGLTLPRARHSSRSSVSSNEELSPSSVASRIAQIGNKIPIGTKKFEPATSEGAPPLDGPSAKDNATSASIAMPFSISGQPPSPPTANSIVMGRARGPARRAPTNLARLPAAAAATTSVDIASQPTVASSTEKMVAKPSAPILKNSPTSAVASTLTTKLSASSITSDPAKKPPIDVPSAARFVAAPTKKPPKKSIFDSSTSDDDDFLATPRSTVAAKLVVASPIVEPSLTTAKASQQSQPATTTPVTGPAKAPSIMQKKSIFDDSDSDI